MCCTPSEIEPFVLASGSDRRRALLQEAGYRFEVVEPTVAEPTALSPTVDPSIHAECLAYFKAACVAGLRRDRTILGADTIAVVDGEVIGKPADRAHAGRILRRLANTTHSVVTGVVLVHPAQGRRLLRHAVSKLRVRDLSDAEIETYLDTGAWEGKAGAYGVQDHGDQYVEHIDGSFSNVVGLPMEMLAEMFDEWHRQLS